jgi:very-short-patch-repair endonuclease
MRRLFTTREARAEGLTMSTLKCGADAGRWRRVVRGVYGQGADEPTDLDRARARILVTAGGVASGHLAGVLHDLDAVLLDSRRVPQRVLSPARVAIVEGVPCADGLQTLVDLAATLDDLEWEQALESALRKRLTTVRALEATLPGLGRARVPGTARIRRVLAIRPPGAPPTESLLETLMVQLARDVPEVGEFVRQHVVRDEQDIFIARLDLSRPDLGFFIELDGQQHAGQPVYDAMRETAVVATTGWLPGRFTWKEVVHLPKHTKRRLAGVVRQARRRQPSA